MSKEKLPQGFVDWYDDWFDEEYLDSGLDIEFIPIPLNEKKRLGGEDIEIMQEMKRMRLIGQVGGYDVMRWFVWSKKLVDRYKNHGRVGLDEAMELVTAAEKREDLGLQTEMVNQAIAHVVVERLVGLQDVDKKLRKRVAADWMMQVSGFTEMKVNLILLSLSSFVNRKLSEVE